jgi:hypothetical protein
MSENQMDVNIEIVALSRDITESLKGQHELIKNLSLLVSAIIDTSTESDAIRVRYAELLEQEGKA